MKKQAVRTRRQQGRCWIKRTKRALLEFIEALQELLTAAEWLAVKIVIFYLAIAHLAEIMSFRAASNHPWGAQPLTEQVGHILKSLIG